MAEIGIAVGSGTDVAIESADIVLMRDDLSLVAQAIALSRRTLRIIQENLFWAFAYNTLGIPVAAGRTIFIWRAAHEPDACGGRDVAEFGVRGAQFPAAEAVAFWSVRRHPAGIYAGKRPVLRCIG